MLIKEIKKDGRTVYVRDRATERFEKIGKFFKSFEFQLWTCGFLFSAVLGLLCLILEAVL